MNLPLANRLKSLVRSMPPGQFIRYLAVGVWNTAFGYALYALFVAVLDPVLHQPRSFLLASILSNVIGISVAFLGYKWFVFKTKGNYLREWLRCFVVYGSSMILGLLLLPVLVLVVRWVMHSEKAAPYVAGAALTGISVIYNFIGHRKYSFRQGQSPTSP